RNYKIGAELIAACEKWVEDQGFDYITLHTTNLMQTAKAMYERRGYERYPEIDFSPSPDFIVFGYRKKISRK
ncbi:MAG TPA: GNAT family N-acetyltransferase, partial [Candidatus Melainabacteria bacterium]|nr:GNAT family N-acetyltransferase [Candidatus Melainabacteria bacterium]